MIDNVNPQEIQKFGVKAESWWDPRGDFRTLHAVNPLRLEFIASKVSLSGARVLDVGCGGGILSEGLAKAGAEVLGIDLGEEQIAVAQQHAVHSQLAIDYRVVAVETLAAESPASFDQITCMEMLEHVPDPASIVRACATLVKPGGHVFFSTLNRKLKAYLLAIVGAEYLMKLIPRGTHDFATFIRPSELTRWAREGQLELKHLTGIRYHPLTGQFSLNHRDLDVNYLAAFRREPA